MRSAPDRLPVISVCHYMTGLPARPEDFRAMKMVKALKGDAINGYFEAGEGLNRRRFRQDNVGDFLKMVPGKMLEAIHTKHRDKATLIPIPNSHVVASNTENFATLRLATEIGLLSRGQLTVLPALVWKEPQKKSRNGGPRSASHCSGAYKVIAPIIGPVILLDDVCTSGGHLVGACWKLAPYDCSVVLGVTFGRTVHEYVDKPVGIHEHTLNLKAP